MKVREVQGGDGALYVIRAEPRDVSMAARLLSLAVVQRLGRLLDRDRAWVIAVRDRSEDPFGPPRHTEVVATRAGVEDALDRVAAAVRAGEVPRTR